MSFLSKRETPDILTCIANLSNDEVFTPPKIVNNMLDLLPQELFRSTFTKFLDPACKSGVFLREIVKRLIVGLEDKLPDLQKRIEHIMRHQVYGIAITNLTAMMARRTVYCTKNVQSKFSQCKFKDEEGRIRFRECAHTYGKDRKCLWCKANEDNEEAIAYEFTHTKKPEDIWRMKFDVIISNPPYQMKDGGFGRSAKPLYQLFIEQAKKLDPKHIVMIIPARWYAGGKGLDDFRREMLNDKHIRVIHDFPDSRECFGDVQIKGGVCYFRWDRDSEGDCEIINHMGEKISVMTRQLIDNDTNRFIRYNEAVSILHKAKAFSEKSFAVLVSQSKPFGLRTYVHGDKDKKFDDDLKFYGCKSVGYVRRRDIKHGESAIDLWKVYIPALGSGSDSFPHPILGRPFVGEPGSVCSETYLVIGPFDDKETCENVISYIRTKFFRFLVLLIKNTQHATQKVYSLVPMQDFTRSWTDEDLYEKYGITPDEIAFIDSMIRPMTAREDAH